MTVAVPLLHRGAAAVAALTAALPLSTAARFAHSGFPSSSSCSLTHRTTRAGTHATPLSAWVTARRFQAGKGIGYGTVAADIDAPRGAEKPSEEEVRRAERRRHFGHTGTAEEAHHEAVSTHVAGYNPWEVLGLKPGASTQTIRLRYHELMKEVHPDMAGNGVGDIPRLNQINKAYELITKSPTLDRRYRNLVSDTQYFYYKFLPEWMARNVDEMPRYWSWVKWRTPGGFHIFLMLIGFYVLGRFYAAFPMLTSVFLLTVMIDILFHTMLAPASLCMLFLYSIMAYRSYDMAWLTSPKGFLRRELGY